jgi:hypothetical protein
MQYLDKVSLSYNREEDRICLRSKITESQILWLWLTNRLARQLVPHLLNSTRVSSHAQSPPLDQGGGNDDSPRNNIEPVPTSAELQEETLVHAINLRSNSEHVELTFQSEVSVAVAKITLSLNDARKLLDGVKACFEAAAWPCDVWCEDPAEATQRHPASVTLH